jgi:hypothetical protein
MSRLVALYPRAWRVRYGDELEELVAARPLGLGGSIDVVLGALDAHRHPELVDPAADPRSTPVSQRRFEDLQVARRLGRASWLGAALWIVGWAIAVNGPIVHDAEGSYRDGGAGAPFILGATVLLAAGMLGQLIRLPRGSRLARAGAIAALVGWPVWGLGPWVLLFLVLGLAGLVILAVGARLAGSWGTVAALSTVGAAASAAALFAVSLVVDGGRTTELVHPLSIAVLVLAPVWLVVGGTLQALPPVAPMGDGIEGVTASPTAA